MGRLPGRSEKDFPPPTDDLENLDTSLDSSETFGIFTKKRHILKAQGDIVFLIAGIGLKEKKYFLWSQNLIEHIEEDHDGFIDAYGAGRVLNPVIKLEGKNFDEFKRYCGNFGLGFTEITTHPFCEELKSYCDLTQIAICKPDENNIDTPIFEGAAKKVIVSRYERSIIGKNKCIKHYGTKCIICGFNFAKTYGELGEGFIEVHHLIPISEVKETYKLDPIKDLRSICSNCHSMIHRVSLLTIEELKEKFTEQNA
jgi:hypothetical protein